jgi:hypothetical protein
MVVRGAMSANAYTLWFVDFFDIEKLLAAIHDERAETYYRKQLTRIVKI